MKVKNKYSQDNLGMSEPQRGKAKEVTKRSKTKGIIKASKKKKVIGKEGIVHR